MMVGSGFVVFRSTCTIALGLLSILAGVSLAWADDSVIAPLMSDDEPIVVSTHRIQTEEGPLEYEARAGRLPIRNDESGEVRGYAFFVAYTVKSAGAPRPLTFVWDGGPTEPAILVHTSMFGPRRLEAPSMVDNAETLLRTSDLVFYDPIGTGFSRPAKPDYDKEFLSVLGDFAATAEFVRAYRVKFATERQPLFLFGESYGTWRVSGTTELLEKRGLKVSGAILLSGGIPGSNVPTEFLDAMYIPARTATAFELKKLSPELMRDKTATVKAAADWAYGVYFPVLQHVAQLSDAERDRIVRDLARFTGVRVEQLDRKTLVMSNRAYRHGLFAGDDRKVLNVYDMRIVGPDAPFAYTAPETLVGYLRNELGFRTELAYTPLENGYMPSPGPSRRSTGERWVYNHTEITPESIARMRDGGGPPLSQPWLQNAMRLDKSLQVYVAAGRYDSLNRCEGNVHMVATLDPDLARRFTLQCYEGGHMMYLVPATRLTLSADLARFIAQRSAQAP